MWSSYRLSIASSTGVGVCMLREKGDREENQRSFKETFRKCVSALIPRMVYFEYQIAVCVDSFNLGWFCCVSVINVGGLVVSSKEMLLMAERSRLYPGKVSNETSCISLM